MALEHRDTVALEGIPGVAVEVIIASEHDTPVQRERHGGDTAHDTLVSVRHELSVSTDIKESATGVIRASTKSHPIREEPIKIKIKKIKIKSSKKKNIYYFYYFIIFKNEINNYHFHK